MEHRKMWWYPLPRDPYDAPSLTMENLVAALDQVRQKVAQTSPYFTQTDAVRNTWVDLLGATITAHPTLPFDPTVDNPIPGAGNLRGFKYRYGVHVTGPCGLHHIMTASEARALASWLMKMSAEEPT